MKRSTISSIVVMTYLFYSAHGFSYFQVNGGRKPAESSLFPSSVNIGSTSAIDSASRSSRVMEGDIINTDVTAPGAAIALALIYIRQDLLLMTKRCTI